MMISTSESFQLGNFGENKNMEGVIVEIIGKRLIVLFGVNSLRNPQVCSGTFLFVRRRWGCSVLRLRHKVPRKFERIPESRRQSGRRSCCFSSLVCELLAMSTDGQSSSVFLNGEFYSGPEIHAECTSFLSLRANLLLYIFYVWSRRSSRLAYLGEDSRHFFVWAEVLLWVQCIG